MKDRCASDCRRSPEKPTCCSATSGLSPGKRPRSARPNTGWTRPGSAQTSPGWRTNWTEMPTLRSKSDLRRSLAAVQEQLKIHSRLEATRKERHAKVESGALGLQHMAAQISEMTALADPDGIHAPPRATRTADLPLGRDCVRDCRTRARQPARSGHHGASKEERHYPPAAQDVEVRRGVAVAEVRSRRRSGDPDRAGDRGGQASARALGPASGRGDRQPATDRAEAGPYDGAGREPARVGASGPRARRPVPAEPTKGRTQRPSTKRHTRSRCRWSRRNRRCGT